MDLNYLIAVVSLLIALSISSERLVEIIKGIFPALNEKNDDPKKEGWRRAALHALAVVAGIVTAFLARPVIPTDVIPAAATAFDWPTLALGLLASGGSGFWNSVLTYLLKVKEGREADANQKQLDYKKVLAEWTELQEQKRLSQQQSSSQQTSRQPAGVS